jgi:pseudaminic acid cytidylyltransferase
MSSGSQTPRFLAVIPARAGSKRIPRKNVRMFHGVPLIARTIQTVLASGVFEDVIVSTDDAEIAEVARQYGSSTPFMRPGSLADDYTPTGPVIVHALDEMLRLKKTFDSVCCVYPAAVLMMAADFRDSSLLADEASGRDALVAAVVRYGHPIQRALKLSADGSLTPLDEGALLKRTQDLEPTWHDAGQFYWASPSRWRASVPPLKVVIPYEVPAWRVQDIDTEEDWLRAEVAYSVLFGQGGV